MNKDRFVEKMEESINVQNSVHIDYSGNRTRWSRYSCNVMSTAFSPYKYYLIENHKLTETYKNLFRPYSKKSAWLPVHLETNEFRTTMLSLFKEYCLSEGLYEEFSIIGEE